MYSARGEPGDTSLVRSPVTRSTHKNNLYDLRRQSLADILTQGSFVRYALKGHAIKETTRENLVRVSELAVVDAQSSWKTAG